MSEPTARTIEMSEKLKALAHPYRLSIVESLGRSPGNVSSIVRRLGIPQPSVSAHLAKLRTAGIIRGERHGQEISYSVVDGDMGRIAAWGLPDSPQPDTEKA